MNPRSANCGFHVSLGLLPAGDVSWFMHSRIRSLERFFHESSKTPPLVLSLSHLPVHTMRGHSPVLSKIVVKKSKLSEPRTAHWFLRSEGFPPLLPSELLKKKLNLAV